MINKIQKQALAVALGIILGASQALAGMSFLHTRGQDVVDAQDNKVLLRGVGLGNWMLTEGYMWQLGTNGDRPRKIEKLISDLIGPDKAARFWKEYRKNFIAQADIKRIAQLGFNSVRPSLNARLFLSEGDNPVYLPEGFDLLDNLVAWCGKQGLYVIIDMHGAPGGQTGHNIDDSADNQPGLFMDKKYQDRLVDLWVKIARRYKDKSAVAAYDLLNEPLPERTGAAAKYKDQLEPLYKRITQAIRAVDKKHMIILEGCNWANDWSVFTARFDDNLVYQFHYYCWEQPDHLKDINQFLTRRAELNAPVWAGEIGEKNSVINWGTAQYLEANNIGWSYWPWKKISPVNTPYSVTVPEGWDAIRAYSQGKDKPSAEVAEKAFKQLLRNIPLEQCAYHANVVEPLFRRVPGRVEAENYGHDGVNVSYSVKARENSKYYRKAEPVPVVPIEAEGTPRRAGQGIKLGAEEWTAYSFCSLKAANYDVTLKVMAQSTPAVIQVSVGEQTQSLTLTNTGWNEIAAGTMPVSKGSNTLKCFVKEGSICLDWTDFKTPGQDMKPEAQHGRRAHGN